MSNICLFFVKIILTQTNVCDKLKLQKKRSGKMKFIEKNKGMLLLYVVIFISTLVLVNTSSNTNFEVEENNIVAMNNN